MNPYRMAPPPRWWGPKLKPWFVRLMRGYRVRRQRREQQLRDITIEGAERVRELVNDGCGVLITPNHPTHADAYSMYAAADAVGTPFHFLSTWHVFESEHFWGQLALQWHGCFSIDREGADMQAFRTAVGIVAEKNSPLVIFPEGEVYHQNDRVTPFREGPAVIALSAAKRAKRPIVSVPCALKYVYTQDPTDALLKVMDSLEHKIFWRPKKEFPLADRILTFADAILMLKEKEWLKAPGHGSLAERTDRLAHCVLEQLEQRHSLTPAERTIPERVKELRSRLLTQLTEADSDAETQAAINDDLDDVFFVVQLFSYPGDYLEEAPSVERLAETLDKFEEDVLGEYSATVRAPRRSIVRFGEPLPVESRRDRRAAAAELTHELEHRVQGLLNAINSELNNARSATGRTVNEEAANREVTPDG